MTATLVFGDPRLPERFWDKLIPEPNSGCWLWIGSLTSRGYGSFYLSPTRTGVAHKMTHKLVYPRLPRFRGRRTVVDHKCRTRSCANPEHGRALREDINVAIGTSPSALNAKKTHCPSGHEYTDENTTTWTSPTGVVKRMCRACRRERSRARNKDRRAHC